MPHSIRQSILITLSLLLCAQALFTPTLLIFLLIVILILFWISSKKAYQLPKRINLLLVVVALSLIYWQNGTFFGVEAGVAILMSFLFAKVLESQNQRDWIVVFNFALFVSASSFLYSSSIWMALMVMLSLLSCLVGLYRLHQLNFSKEPANLIQDSRHMGKLLLYAMPFFLILFLFFPRLPPLWQMPIKSDAATTGLSDQMAPGDIANLSQSSALAFRIVTNINALPPQQNLYWRGMVLDHYDGTTWSADASNHQPLILQQDQLTPRLNYQYLPADTASKWIMALEYSLPMQRGYYLQQDAAIRMTPSRQSSRLNLVWLGEQLPQPLNPAKLKRNQIYQTQQDLQAQNLAQRLYQQSAGDAKTYIARVLAWYQTQGFQYSLSPGRLEGDHIDDFLFDKKQGFCEHYASSFVMLMRYVGIPARVVVGYQGGQAAPDGKSWEVRQQDAHAWSEVWLDQRWQRIDPTAVIAPERIQQGIQYSLWQQQSPFKQQQLAWSNRMQIWSDFAAYQWQSKVVGYDQTKQMHWLSSFGLSTPLRLILFTGLTICIFLAMIWLLHLIRNYLTQSSYERSLIAFEQSLVVDLKRQTAESHAAWLQRLSRDLDGELAEFLRHLTDYDRQYRYRQSKTAKLPAQLKFMLKKCSNTLNLKHKSLS
jgi:protein-glutamine gamma-glutamyltransferase